MGNCMSTPAVTTEEWQQQQGGGANGQQHYKSGKNAHDSVHSLDTAGTKDSSNKSHPGNNTEATSTSSSNGSSRRRRGSMKAAKHDSTAAGAGSGGKSPAVYIAAGSNSGSEAAAKKRRRPPGFDIATGKGIPDFHVNGVLDVLHELGSGGSGTTYLCRDLATSKVGMILLVLCVNVVFVWV